MMKGNGSDVLQGGTQKIRSETINSEWVDYTQPGDTVRYGMQFWYVETNVGR